jgi:hypothetical protein
MNGQETVIFDWQGTLVDVRGIRHLVENTDKKNFPEFHRQTGLCPPIEDTVEAAKRAAFDDKFIVIMTGCSDDFQGVLANWLGEHGVPFNMIMMRKAGDWRRDVVIKREMLEWLREHGHDVVHAHDDNPNIVALWNEENIPVTVVPGWGAS